MIVSDVADGVKAGFKESIVKEVMGEKSMFDTNEGGGLIGGLILGSLLRNGGNLFGNEGVVGRGCEPVTATKGDVWQAEGQVQLAIAQDTISNLQGNALLTKAITDSASASQLAGLNAELALLEGQRVIVGEVGTAAKDAAVANALTNSVVSLGNANTAALIAQSKFDIAQVVHEEGEKTRHLIDNINLATLNRELAVAQTALSDSHHHARSREVEVNVSQNVNQVQQQAQQQQQFMVLNNALGVLLGEIQRNTQSTVAIGSTLTGNSQTATNNRVS